MLPPNRDERIEDGLPSDAGPSTRAIHAGERTDPWTRAHTAPIYLTDTFAFDSVADHQAAIERALAGGRDAFVYARSGNPTTAALERKVADLEGAEASQVCASGMAAVSAAMLALLDAGDHCVVAEDVYLFSGKLADELLVGKGVAVTRVDAGDHPAVDAALRPETKVLFVESLSNPGMDFADLDSLGRFAHAKGVLLIVDNTFLSPVLFRPLEHCADLVLNSATKYMNGHGDVRAGTASGSRELVDRVHGAVEMLGGALSPFNAWLVLRGLQTLPLRMRAHSANALELADFLGGHPAVEWVRYVGLAEHPQHELAREHLPRGYGGMLTLRLRGGGAEMRAFVNALKLGAIAVSLGDLKTLVDAMPEHDHTIRVSVGCEDLPDLLDDFGTALSAVSSQS